MNSRLTDIGNVCRIDSLAKCSHVVWLQIETWSQCGDPSLASLAVNPRTACLNAGPTLACNRVCRPALEACIQEALPPSAALCSAVSSSPCKSACTQFSLHKAKSTYSQILCICKRLSRSTREMCQAEALMTFEAPFQAKSRKVPSPRVISLCLSHPSYRT